MQAAFKLLGEQTYVVERNVNCPSEFLVRLVGRQGCIDKELPGTTKDCVGYGKTLLQAVRAALTAQSIERAKFRASLKLYADSEAAVPV